MTTTLENQLIFAAVSIVISVVIYVFIRIILCKIFINLSDIKKLIKFIAIVIIIGELIYLGHDFKLFFIASEIIASMGVTFGLLSLAFQNYLKNIAAGLGNYLKKEINIGDKIEISDKNGVIVEMGLTQTTIMQKDGSRIFIPNSLFVEKEYQIFRKKIPCDHVRQLKDDILPKSNVCIECQKSNDSWVSLRLCLSCGNVGCDRTSVNRHAEKHFKETGHPVIIDLPEKKWRWCYLDNTYF